MDLPKDSKYVGRIQSVDDQDCLVSFQKNSEAVLHFCRETIDNQMFVLTELGELRNHELCMAADSRNGKVKTLKCNQKWAYDMKKKIFRHSLGSCLQRDTATEPWVNEKPCDGSRLQQ